MRLLLRFWFAAAFLGAVVGYGVRSLPRRPHFGVLVLVGLLPVVAHAVYVYQLASGAGAGSMAGQSVSLFMMVTAGLLAVGSILGWRLARSAQRAAALVPALVGLLYAGASRFLVTGALEPLGIAPNALFGASVSMLLVGVTAALLVASRSRSQAGEP